MKKTAFIFLFLACSVRCFCQDHALNHEKYWYYRYRLINDFVKIGASQGCSMPMNQRHLYTVFSPSDAGTPSATHTSTGKWGDGTITLGHYIGVLATEYYLLASNGQNTDQTVKELYYALRALNRLDSIAEPTYRLLEYGSSWSEAGDINGFFMRDDVPPTFINDNFDHFNSHKIKYRNTSNVLDVPGQLDFVDSDYQRAVQHNDDDLTEESQDQVWHVFMGLSLVTRFVPTSANYNGYAFNDGETSIAQEAKILTNRIHAWYLNDPLFRIFNPVYNEPVQIGQSVYPYIYGAAKAACAVNGHHGYEGPFPPGCWAYGAIPGLRYVIWQSYKLTSSASIVSVPFALFNEYHKVMQLAALGNSFYNIGSVNTTATNVSVGSAIHEWYYLPLLRQVLHGGPNYTSETVYNILLNDAPCEGPYNFGYPSHSATFNYSSTNVAYDPQRRGEDASGDDKIDGFYGAMNGLDYMLYHNLYYIIRKDDYYKSPTDLINRNVTAPLPFTFNIPSGFLGTVSVPALVKGFERINVSSVIAAALSGSYSSGNPFNTKITFQAGEEIVIKPGHIVQAGADIHYLIKPFECAGSGQYVRLASSDSIVESSSASGSLDGGGTSIEEYNRDIAYNYHFDERDVRDLFGEDLVQDTSALKEIMATGFTAYPNPSNGVFKLKAALPAGPCRVIVYDVRGAVVYEQEIDFSEELTHEIDISKESPGLYLLKLQSKDLGQEIIRRIQKQ